MKPFSSPSPVRWVATGLLLIAAGPAVAAPPSFAGSLALTSDYVFRGVSQTLGRPAAQLGASADWDTISVFLWGSNVDFGDDTADLELDLGLSWSPELGDEVDLTLSFLRYVYPGDRGSDYSEVLVELGLGDLHLILAGSPDYFGTPVRALYSQVGHRFELPHGLTLSCTVGYSAFLGRAGGERLADYFDAAVSVTRDIDGITFGLSLSSTTLDADSQGTTRLVASIRFDL